MSLTVPLRDEDIPITLARTAGNAITEQESVLTYQITYGSLLSYDIPLTIQAAWSDATINGSLVPLAYYVTYSATNAYNGTPAVIDTVNKVISWTIPSLPAHTPDQIVSFRLKTNSNYIGTSKVFFTVSTGAQSNGSSVTPVTLTQYYQHTPPSTSSSSSSSSSTALSLPLPTQSTITPTVTSVPVVPVFSSIDIQTISSNSATAVVSLTTPAKLTIRYGITPSSLTKTLKIPEFVSKYLVFFPDLVSNTQYYFTITAETIASTTPSDIYLFTTAKGNTNSFVTLSSLIITANNTILSTDTRGNGLSSTIITTDTPFEFRFAVSNSEQIRSIKALMRQAKVLGINTYDKDTESDISTDAVEIVEIAPGVYNGRLKTKHSSGAYTLFARILDEKGNITEQAIASILVVKPLTILEAGSKKPIENARVLIYRKNPKTGEYVVLSKQSLATKNPIFSEPDGTIKSELIQGDYKVQVSATGYDQQEKEFTLSAQNAQEYPVIYLKKGRFSIIGTAQFYSEITKDVFSSFFDYTETLANSNRLYKLASLITLCFFVIVTTLSFCIRFHIPFSALPAYFISHLHLHRNKKNVRMISGSVMDETNGGFPIKSAIIYLLDQKRRRILLHTQTNTLGQFTLPLTPAASYLLIVKKRNYLSEEHIISSLENTTISLKKDQTAQLVLFGAIRLFCLNTIGLLFEILLFLSFVLESIFAMSLGFVTVSPYLLLSIANLVLWLLFVKNQRSIYSSYVT
jgi:hypothetical protein